MVFKNRLKNILRNKKRAILEALALKEIENCHKVPKHECIHKLFLTGVLVVFDMEHVSRLHQGSCLSIFRSFRLY